MLTLPARIWRRRKGSERRLRASYVSRDVQRRERPRRRCRTRAFRGGSSAFGLRHYGETEEISELYYADVGAARASRRCRSSRVSSRGRRRVIRHWLTNSLRRWRRIAAIIYAKSRPRSLRPRFWLQNACLGLSSSPQADAFAPALPRSQPRLASERARNHASERAGELKLDQPIAPRVLRRRAGASTKKPWLSAPQERWRRGPPNKPPPAGPWPPRRRSRCASPRPKTSGRSRRR